MQSDRDNKTDEGKRQASEHCGIHRSGGGTKSREYAKSKDTTFVRTQPVACFDGQPSSKAPVCGVKRGGNRPDSGMSSLSNDIMKPYKLMPSMPN